MAITVGRVTSIEINFHKVSFLCNPEGDKPQVKLILFSDASNTLLVAQMEIATRSWMIALLQTALVHNKPVIISHGEDNVVEQIHLADNLNFDFNFGGGTPKPERPLKSPIQKGPAVKRPIK